MPITFNNNSTVSIEENSTGAVRNVQASLDGGAADAGLSYSITGGADAALFTVNSTTGMLSFIAAPDYEAPGDDGGDNVYNVTVQATDGGSETATQDLTITVTDDKVESTITSIRPVIELSELNGDNGFILNGVTMSDLSGYSVSSAGDVNGDGYDDLIIGAGGLFGGKYSGDTYVVFGGADAVSSNIDLIALDGGDGFVLKGFQGNYYYVDDSGISVSSAGDVNGDGYDDLIIGAPGVDSDAGVSYVVFGASDGFDSEIELSVLDGSNGFVLNGVTMRDRSGRSVSSAGDVNGDGYDDLIIGAYGADPNGISNAGTSYVVFGKAGGFTESIELSALDGNDGFAINGVASRDYSGRSVSSAGDINGDGYDDLIIGAYSADRNGSSSGTSYVVFGKAGGFTESIELSALDGSDGFALNGVAADDQSGFSVSSAGDVNGDGYDDLIIGAKDAGPNGDSSGTSYVVFGKAGGFADTIELSALDGSDGFVLNGVAEDDQSGFSVSSAGDVNGDGIDDLIIGALNADPNGSSSGTSYVVFGKVGGFTDTIELSDLDGSDGFALNGGAADDRSGGSVSAAGDVNGDGYDDLIIGASGADPNGNSSAGTSYVVYGGPTLEKSLVFNSRATANFEENSTGAVRNIQASLDVDPADAGLSYSITGGADAALFTVNAITGVLSFIAAPDYEAPGDAGGDNVYNVTVEATDGGSVTASQDLTITVTDDATGVDAITDTVSPVIELSELNGDNGFTLNGVAADDYSAVSVASAGDVNGDGYDDLIIGANWADPNGDKSGTSYVVFGKAGGFTDTIELSTLDGDDGFALNGVSAFDRSGFSVSSAGDVNGDGYDDLIIGAFDAVPNDILSAGTSYVVFGKAGGFTESIELSALNGNDGFALNGVAESDYSGISVSSAGDINGDGYDDLIIGAFVAGNSDAGTSYVVFGKSGGFTESIELSALDGNDGFALNGVAEDDYSGRSVSSAGDVNGDGYDDLIIGAYGADPNGTSYAGTSYVVFGKAGGFTESIELSALDGNDGFALNGVADDNRSGRSVSAAGDVNGDGFDDLIVGAFVAGNSVAGVSYVVFGKSGGFTESIELSALDGSDGFALNGVNEYDFSGFSVSAAGDVNGDGYDDLIIGAPYADPNGDDSGTSYVVFGKAGGFTDTIELSTLDGSDGFALNGVAADDRSGASVSAAGDVNGDGYDDLIIGANGADPNDEEDAGASYVVFGGPTLSAGVSAPTSSGGSGSVTAGDSLSFSEDNFNFVDANTDDSLASVRIDTLPAEGTLKLSGVDVTAGQVIAAADIANLTYRAPSGSATSVSFTYSVNDGTDFSAIPATMTLAVTAAPVAPNNPPTAPTLSGLSLLEDSPGATVGTVNSNDPDVDPITYSVSDSRFEIVGTTLKLKAGQSVDFEAQQTIGLTITATDSNNASQSSSFTITVRDVNEVDSTDGNDVITGVDGNDSIKSESGDDVVSAGNGEDTIDGGSGNDDIDGGDDDDLLFGGSGNDTVKGGGGEDVMRGGSGNDMVESGDGDDLVFAGAGDDGDDTVDGDPGNDTLGGGVGNDNISGGDGDDLLWGELGDDSLMGGVGGDLIFNGEGSDTVDGGDGDDVMWAGEDDDLLTGGEGADLFVFGDISGNDTVTDFDADEDVLDVQFASTDFTSLADVVAAGSETSQDGQDGVLIDLGDSDSVFIVGIQLDDLTASNVTF